MKNKFLLGVMVLLALVTITGCSDKKENNSVEEKLTCTKSETDEDGYKTDETVVVTYKDNYVTKVDSTFLMETDPEYLEMTIGFMQVFTEAFNQVEGMNYTVSKEGDSKIKQNITIDYEKLDVDKMKELFSDSEDSEDSFFINPDETHVTIDEFKENDLEGYTCK